MLGTSRKQGRLKFVGLALTLLASSCGPTPKRAFPGESPWLAYWGGDANAAGDLGQLAKTFRLILMNGNPDDSYWTADQVTQVKAGGKNRVLSYLNVGSCEQAASYWSTVPSGFVSCSANVAAQLGPYTGYAEEWMDPSNADFQKLILGYIAPRLMALPLDGFFLDNMELVDHGTNTTNGPCDAGCAQGALDLVRLLRDQYPDALIVMNHGTGDTARLGTTGGVPFPTLVDGVNQEGVYLPSYNATLESELLAWKSMKMTRGGTPFLIGTTDYVQSCTDSGAQDVFKRSRANGFSPTATVADADQVCYWPF